MPLRGSQRMHGVLTMARLAGRVAFSAEDLEMASGFATHAAVALELAEARLEQQRAAMLDERERIAADLHDQVIQRLFATGLSLQGLLGSAGPGRVAERIQEAVRSLDDTISQIRTTIFGLSMPGPLSSAGTRAQLLDVVAELTPALGLQPALRFTGILDTVPAELTEDLLAVLREALSNIARHAHARSVEIDVAAGRDRVELTVHDDGVGIPPDRTRSSGLANLRHRAERHGGTLTLTPRQPVGTSLCWWVPHA
jgi:signal transduction histidine kinase